MEKVSRLRLPYDIEETLEEALELQSIEEDLRRGDIVQHLRDAEDLYEALQANQVDLERAAQDALDQQKEIEDALGEETLEDTIELAEHHYRALLDIDRIARITAQLDADHFARTLRRAQELRSEAAAADILAQHFDIEAATRAAEDAMEGPLSGTGGFPGTLTVGPPEWMRKLSRENLLILIKVLIPYIKAFYVIYAVSLTLSDGNISDAEIEKIVGVLLITLEWAYSLLKSRENDN
jgi:hypothetical protein